MLCLKPIEDCLVISELGYQSAYGAPVLTRKYPYYVTAWERFVAYITSTDHRLYIGWFKCLMIPTLLTAICTVVFPRQENRFFERVEKPHVLAVK